MNRRIFCKSGPRSDGLLEERALNAMLATDNRDRQELILGL